jgi:hypothetical protein
MPEACAIWMFAVAGKASLAGDVELSDNRDPGRVALESAVDLEWCRSAHVGYASEATLIGSLISGSAGRGSLACAV